MCNWRRMKNGFASPSSSPPTPPSPLPVSIGPGYQSYFFSSSPSPSPPFSPPPSSHTSLENLPLLPSNKSTTPLRAPSAFSLDRPNPNPDHFSLDRPNPNPDDRPDSKTSCLQDLLEWLVLRCCSCCSWFL